MELSLGAPEAPRDEMVRSVDEEDRTILRVHPTTVFLNG
jgi:hypothetical protein